MGLKGYPQQQLENMDPSAVQELVTSLQELHKMGRPQTDEELERRIDEYFSFCQRSSVRPGIESLCLALHITRQCLYNWSSGIQASERRRRACESAKAFIAAYIEQASLSGKINPACGIFLMKNWLNYKDNIGLEPNISQSGVAIAPLTREAIAAEFGTIIDRADNIEELPHLPIED